MDVDYGKISSNKTADDEIRNGSLVVQFCEASLISNNGSSNMIILLSWIQKSIIKYK